MAQENSSFTIHRSAFIVAMAVFYVAATLALFARFLFLAPFSFVAFTTVSVTLVSFFVTRHNRWQGLLVLTFVTPLMGSLIHFTPNHAASSPPLLMVIAGFAVGWLVGRRDEMRDLAGPAPVGTHVAAWLFLLLAISGLLTVWRYLEFAPFGGWPTLSAAVNLRPERASVAIGGIWEALVISLCGPLVYVLATTIPRNEDWLGQWVRVLLVGVALACLVGLLQALFFPSFGTSAHWAGNNRINATFTDPNGLGTFMALSVPLAVALVLGASDRWSRWLGVAVLLLAPVMLAGSGSRTGFLGVALAGLLLPGILALRFHVESEVFRHRVVFASVAFVVAVVAFLPLDCNWEGKRWALPGRLVQTREMIARQGVLAPLVRDRWPLWEPAAYVAAEYPIGGIGLGAFRFEVENIAHIDGRDWRWIDNANNFYILTVGEMGLPGLAIVLAAFGVLAAAIVRVIRSRQLRGETRALYAGLAAAWIGFLVLLLTAMWLLFEQIQVAFWLYAAAFAVHEENRRKLVLPTRRSVTALAAAAIALMAVFQFAHGVSDLSLTRRRSVLGIEVARGFHAWETDLTGRRFRWTQEKARVMVPTTRNEIRFEIQAFRPDLATRPLKYWTTLDGQSPQQYEATLPQWQWIRIPVPPGTRNPAELVIHVENTWRPTKDGRELGIAVGRIENVDASQPLPPSAVPPK